MAVSFRKRQVIADLVTVARRATVSTLSRMADNAPSAQRMGMAAHLAAAIAADGRISGPNEDMVRETALLTASLPDLDYDAFSAATALILADGLQGGGEETLFWHWDAFQAHYALAERPVRAAILQGYLLGAATGRFTVDPLPPRTVATSEVEADITKSLRALVADASRGDIPRDVAAASLYALSGRDVDAVAQLWAMHGDTLVQDGSGAARVATHGVRHVFERLSAFEPESGAALLPSLPQNKRDTAKRA